MSTFSSEDFVSSVKQIRNGIWAFPPKKDSKGVVSWWLHSHPVPVLIDCPEVTSEVIKDLKKLAGGASPEVILTSRNSHGDINLLSKELGWPVFIQEQEAYLLPEIKNISSFSDELITKSGLRVLWTPGPTPGSCIAYASSPWNVVFCGRLLIPVAKNKMDSVRTRMTFHWSLQQSSIEKLRKWLPSEPRLSLASSAGFHFIEGGDLVSWDSVKFA